MWLQVNAHTRKSCLQTGLYYLSSSAFFIYLPSRHTISNAALDNVMKPMIFSTTSKFFVLKSTVLYYVVRVSVGVVPMAIFLRHKKESQLHAQEERHNALEIWWEPNRQNVRCIKKVIKQIIASKSFLNSVHFFHKWNTTFYQQLLLCGDGLL